jgi:EF hand
MYRKALTIAAIIFPALSVTAVYAAGPGAARANDKAPMSARAELQVRGAASNPPSFSKADANHDGLIEPEEADAIGIPFATLDADHDGIVTRSEYSITTAHYYRRSAIQLHSKAG